MTTIRTIVKTQKIVVDNPRNSVSVINAGPPGPPGPQGVSNVLTVLTADDQLLTRATGALAPITRANLAADSVFTSRYLELADFTADGQIMSRASGVVAPITRATLAADTAFSSAYQPKRATGTTQTPAGSGNNGEEYYDTSKYRLWRSDGVAWRLVSGKMPRVEAGKLTTQSCGNASVISVTFPTENYDTDTMHSTSTNTDRLTVATGFGGLWYASYSLYAASHTSAGRFSAWMSVNGAGVRRAWSGVSVSANQDGILTGSVNLALLANDYLTVSFYQENNATTSRDIGHTTLESYFQMTYLGPA